MKSESKLARQKKAARRVAEIMYASLQQFSEEEQEKRIKEIHKISRSGPAKRSRSSLGSIAGQTYLKSA
jgi:hypothetical protein